jgi:hypothetical protein
MASSDVFFGAGNKTLRSNDAIIFQYFAHIGQWLYVNFCFKLMRQDHLQGFRYIVKHTIDVGVRKNETWDVLTPHSKAAVLARLETYCYFERTIFHGDLLLLAASLQTRSLRITH